MKDIKDAVALVTGANRGLGLALVQELLAKGAAKVYAGSRKPHDFNDPRVVNIILDVTDAATIATLPKVASDATIVVNNAGVFMPVTVLGVDMAVIRGQFETNVFGPIQIAQAMAPVLKTNGGGALINIISVASWLPLGSYAASKAALWSATNSLRQELKAQGTQVVGVQVGPIDTEMVRGLDLPKHNPNDVARAALGAIKSGESEVLFDDFSRHIKALLSGPVDALKSPV